MIYLGIALLVFSTCMISAIGLGLWSILGMMIELNVKWSEFKKEWDEARDEHIKITEEEEGMEFLSLNDIVEEWLGEIKKEHDGDGSEKGDIEA